MTVRIDQRRSGVLLHPTALPSRFGIGDFGPAAYQFVDWLAAGQQSFWQVLPLMLPDVVGSPYASSSAFAGNWLLISPELLARDGWLDRPTGWSQVDEPVHYPQVGKRKAALLETAWRNFQQRANRRERAELRRWRRHTQSWIEDVVLFAALKEHFGFDVPWTRWPVQIRKRHHREMVAWRRRLKPRLDFYAFCQWQFDRQWRKLKRYANSRGVAIIGDLPIYVTRDSVDTWAEPKNFLLDGLGRPRLVAGVPPDYFSRRGQVWGDPLYDWKHIEQHGFNWWMRRLARSFELYDAVRLDHFRGYVAAWGIRAGSRSARHGSWHAVPGEKLLRSAQHRWRQRFIAEDLGVITEDVNQLRNRLGFPGVRVAQFGFERLDSIHTVKNFSRRTVAYTGTHDNNTTRGWLAEDVTRWERRHLRELMGRRSNISARRLVAMVLASRANLVVVPLQDVLDLGSSARFNTPGKREGNWQWRFKLTALTSRRRDWLRALTRQTRRAPK
ncbi:MAG: 4-alpha-glucanotransferase [Candidatus Kerfeldbacteria bacterium]|nr:4-alpha-glucanotransferase [Candidatus Kerfeldbacteria bacterium]